jgi:hypothetical protein
VFNGDVDEKVRVKLVLLEAAAAAVTGNMEEPDWRRVNQ